MSDYLQLGPVSFHGFEMPPRICFGGAQRLAVHTLPGGVRVIDAMGRDDADITWSGIFSGIDAADRARLLDVLRAEGNVLPLAWEAFCYLVVIAGFEAHYEYSTWVPYRITCRVVQDQTQPSLSLLPALAAMLLGDLAAATGVDSAAVSTALAAGDAMLPGTPGFAAAQVSFGTLGMAISAQMSSAGATLLAAPDPASAAAAAGRLATLADGRGFVSRAAANLDNAEG